MLFNMAVPNSGAIVSLHRYRSLWCSRSAAFATDALVQGGVDGSWVFCADQCVCAQCRSWTRKGQVCIQVQVLGGAKAQGPEAARGWARGGGLMCPSTMHTAPACLASIDTACSHGKQPLSSCCAHNVSDVLDCSADAWRVSA